MSESLRHSAISRMIVAKLPFPSLPSQLAESDSHVGDGKKYDHYEHDDLRTAVNSITSAGLSP